MPRAFLVVKKSEDNSPPRTTSKENFFLSRPEKRLYPSEDSPFYSPRTYSCASGSEDDLSPSPPSSPESLGPLVPDYSMATMTTPREHVHRGGAGGLVQTPGVFPFVNINGAFDMSQKRQRLDMTATSTDDKDLLSPRSTMSSDSDGSHASSSSPGPADIKYMLPKPRLMTKDSHSPMRAFRDHHSRDMVEPLSPLHHLVHSSSYKAAALAAAAVAAGYPAGFGFPTSPMGLAAFPGLGMPMFYPHPMRPYPPPEMLQTSKPSMTPPREKLQVKREDDTEAAPAPKPKTSHNIEDLLARSPPKSKKPVDVPTTVHQYRPVPIVQSCSSDDEKDDDLLVNNPMQKLFEMDKKLAESPKTRLFSPVAHQSPKSGDFPPESMAFHKNKQVQRNLELSFSSSSRGFPGIESMLPGGVNNHQLYAQSYQKLMHAQRTHEDLRRVESDDDEGPSKKIIRMEHHVREYVPDVNTNHCVNATHDFSETVFPRRHGDEVKDMPIHERLSPDALENVPVDFTTSSSTNRKPGPPRFQCDGCKKSYSTMNGLSKHKEFHCSSHVKKEFSCKHCNKTYTSLGALKMHIRTHTLPCKCHICGKAFSRPWLLQGHIRTHTGEKPFSCQHCNRSFADRSNLRAHLQTHTDIKRYCCKICNKTFSRMSLLTKHKENGCAGGMH